MSSQVLTTEEGRISVITEPEGVVVLVVTERGPQGPAANLALLDTTDTEPPAGTPYGTILFRKGSGTYDPLAPPVGAIGWWDGSQIQPLGN